MSSALKIHSIHQYKNTLSLLSVAQQFTQYGARAISTEVDDNYRLVYEGPLSNNIKYVKRLSIFTATCSISFAPAAFFMGKESVSMLGKGLLAGTILTIGVSTTTLLHWVTRVYVNKLYFDAEERMFIAETLSLFGTRKRHSFHVGDVEIPKVESAFSTFIASGRKYFIHLEFKEGEQIMSYIRDYNYERDISIK